jgi:flagellar motor protein MotB
MKAKTIIFCMLVLFFSSPVLGQINEAIETNWEGVTAKLVTCQQDEYKLYVQVVVENTGEKEAKAGIAICFKDIYLVDPNTDTKVFILKDANGYYLGGPLSDRNDGGRWWVSIPAQGKTTLWAIFPPLPGDSPMIDVVVPEIFPFEGIEVAVGSFEEINDHETNLFPANATLISTRRSKGAVSVRLRLSNETERKIGGGAIWYNEAFLYDFHNGRKYPILKDEEGNFIAEPISDHNKGGRWWPSYLNKKGKQLMYLKFQAPHDDVKEVSVVIPSFIPFIQTVLQGKSGITDHSGIQVIGVQTSLKRMLKDLNAEETEEEIKIQLSSEVLFDFDKSQLRAKAEPVLGKVLQVVKEYPNCTILIEGHTDSTGSDEYNLTLSEKRAQSVEAWFLSSGISESKISTAGRGESKPVASNVLYIINTIFLLGYCQGLISHLPEN